MYYVNQPKSDGSKEYETLAKFIVKEQAIDYAMQNLNANEDGLINVVSDDGEEIYEQHFTVELNGCPRNFQVFVEETSNSDNQVTITFYLEDELESTPIRTDDDAIAVFQAYYLSKSKDWHLTGHNYAGKTCTEIVEHCLESIKTNAQPKAKAFIEADKLELTKENFCLGSYWLNNFNGQIYLLYAFSKITENFGDSTFCFEPENGNGHDIIRGLQELTTPLNNLPFKYQFTPHPKPN